MARATELSFEMLVRISGKKKKKRISSSRRGSRSVLRVGADRILFRSAVKPKSQREGKNKTVLSPHHIQGIVLGAYMHSSMQSYNMEECYSLVM